MVAAAIALPYLILFTIILQSKGQSQRVKAWAGALLVYLTGITIFYAIYAEASVLPQFLQSPLALPLILSVESILIGCLITSVMRREKEIMAWLAISAVWLASLVFIDSLEPGNPAKNWGTSAVAIGGWAVITAVSVINTLVTAKKLSPKTASNRMKSWLFPLILFMVGSIAAFFVPMERQLSVRIIHFFAAIAMTYIFLAREGEQFNTLNTPLRYLIYVLSVGLLILIATWIGLITSRVSGSITAQTVITMASAMAISIAVTFFADKVRLLVFTSETGEVVTPSARLLYSYSQQINQQTELKQLARFISQTIVSTLDVKNAHLILPTEYNSHIMLEPLDEEFLKKGKTGIFTIKNPIYQYFTRNNDILLHYDLEKQLAFASLSKAEQDFLKSLHAELYAPISKRGVIIGFLAIGPKNNGGNFTKNDIDLIFTFSSQAATALENARLINDLQDSYRKTNKLNEALQTSNEHLQRIDKIKGDFITIASHELRTPLTVICGYSEMLKEFKDLPPENMTMIVDSLNESSNKMSEIIEMLIEVAQIDIESMELDFEEIPIGTLIRETTHTFETALAERMLELTIEGLDELPVIEADESRLKRVIFNILSNAVKFTPNGGEITIRGMAEQSTLYPGSEAVHIMFTDTGIGIRPEEKDLVFEKFYRTDSILTHSSGDVKFKGGGPGLGLTISKRIVEGHNGRIWVESPGYSEELLPGSTFHLVLPLKPRAISDQRMIRQIQATNAETIIASPEMRKAMIRERENRLSLKTRQRSQSHPSAR